MHKLISRWTGFPGSPGFTVMYFQPTQTTAPADMRAFWAAIVGLLPANVTIQVDGSGDVIDETTGDLTGVWTGVQPASVVGTSVGTYPAPTGMLVRWNTAGIVNGRRVRGKTFIVPAAGNAYATDGTLDTPDITTLVNAAQGLIDAAGSTPQVWARPFPGSVNDPIPRAGSAHNITTAIVPDKAVVLTSRRD